MADLRASHSVVERAPWALAIVAFLVVFALPGREGLGFDPALYGAMARSIVRTGQWWPIRIHDQFYPVFYEHPPLVLWAMAAMLKLFGPAEWTTHLFARLCGLGAVLVGFLLAARSTRPNDGSARYDRASGVLFLLLFLSWGRAPGILSAGSLETALMLGLLVVTWATRRWLDDESPGAFRRWAPWIFTGAVFASFSKGVFGYPLPFALMTWGVVSKRNRRALSAGAVALVGMAVPLAVLAYLDAHTGSKFFEGYFIKNVFGSTVGTLRGAPALEARGSRLLASVLEYARVHWKGAMPWWPAVLVAMTYVLSRRRAWLSDRTLTLSLGVWVALNLPHVVSSGKAPAWTVFTYPFGAIFLARVLARGAWSERLASFLHERRATVGATVLALVVGALPMHRWVSLREGGEWNARLPEMKEAAKQGHALWVVRAPEDYDDWTLNSYASFYALPHVPLRIGTAADATQSACTGGWLVGQWGLIQAWDARLQAAGWKPVPWDGERGFSRFYRCAATGGPPSEARAR